MSKEHSGLRLLAVAVAAMAALCLPRHSAAIFGLGGDDEPQGRAVWQSGEQYVRIVEAWEAGNEHPVALEPGLLSHALQQVMVKEKRRLLYYGQYDPIPLLPPQLAGTLGKALHKALGSASAGEDAVFLVQGVYKKLSVLNEVRGTTGRAFYRNGRLHIIFGEVLRSDKQGASFNADLRGIGYESKRSAVYRTARRNGSLDTGWEFEPGDGVSSGNRGRADWIELDLAHLAKAVPVATEEGSAAAVSPQAEQERRQMLLDMARMRKDIEQLRKGGGSAAGASSGGDAASVQRRLETLQALRENELITAEEYEAKRRQIIDQL